MPPPVSYGLTLCDLAIVEAKTSRVSLVNTFSGISATKFPVKVPLIAAYTVLTDALGDVILEFTISSLDTGEQVYHHTRRQTFPNRLQEVQFLLRIKDLLFLRPAKYEAALFADGQWVCRRPFSVYPKGMTP